MNASVYRFYLDVHKPHSGVCLDVKRGDANSRLLLITLSERGVPYRISPDCYAVFTAVKPDGKKVFNHCTIDGDQISYVLTPQTVAVDGRLNCEIKLYGADDMLITSSCFDIIVRPTVYNEGDIVESEQEVDALLHLISEATTVISASKATKEECEALIALLEAQSEELHQMVDDIGNAVDSTKESAESALKSSRDAKKAAEEAYKSSQDAKAAAESASDGGSAGYVLLLSRNEADAQANTDAVTEAIATHGHVILKAGDYPVKPGIVIESGKLDMNGSRFYTVDYKSSTPLVYLKGEAPEICNGELEGSYDLADTEAGYAFFEGESLICPQGVNDAYIHNMDLHNNWGYCILPGEDVERVYVETATKVGNNDYRFVSASFKIPEGFKYVTAAGGVGYNYIISSSPVKYHFYDEGGKEITIVAGIPRERRAIPNGAKTVAFETTLDSETFVTYYAYFTNYTEALTVTDCKFHNFHSLGMANMPGPTIVTRCSFVDGGRPRSDAPFTTRATTGGIDIEDVQTPVFVMSDCFSKDCLKILMFGGYKGTITNCIGDNLGVYRGWQCDITNCNVNNLYTMGGYCRISLNGVHANEIGIKPENAKDVRGNISTNFIPTGNERTVFSSFDNFVVKMSDHSSTHGKLSGKLNGTVRSISTSGIRWNGFSSKKGSRVVIDSTLLPKSNGNYYGALSVDGETYGLESSIVFMPKGNTIHDSTFNIAFPTSAYSSIDGEFDGAYDNCVFNLTGSAYFRRFIGTLTKPIALTFKNCTINNASYHLFNFVPDAGGVVTFENCTIADESKLFNGDASRMTINITGDRCDAHIQNQNNPHGVTIAQIGAAPAGYGLGGSGKLLTSADNIDDITANGTYWWYESRPTGALYNYCVMRVDSGDKSSKGYVTQTIYRSSGNGTIVRHNKSGEWIEEWDNPPMVLGVEYRTTERWQGKAVYTKLISFGALPNTATGSVSVGADELNVISLHGVSSNGNYIYDIATMPGVSEFAYNYWQGTVVIATTADKSGYKNTYITIKYTKD